jgi:transcriptional regulator of arginine metabolism
MSKDARLAAIIDILGRRPVGGQQQLRVLLAERGFSVSQSSLSRDLKELGVQRQRTAEGLFAYVVPADRPPATSEETFRLRFRTSVTGIRRVEFIVLVFTPPGEAQLIGRLLDSASLPGLAGTLAGDDTVICIAAGKKGARDLESRFTDLLD